MQLKHYKPDSLEFDIPHLSWESQPSAIFRLILPQGLMGSVSCVVHSHSMSKVCCLLCFIVAGDVKDLRHMLNTSDWASYGWEGVYCYMV